MMKQQYIFPAGVTASDLAHLYSRVSSAAQLAGEGLSRQIEATDQWVSDYDLTIVKTYTDRGVSAFRGRNRRDGELAHILKAIEAGVIKAGEHLIIESVDRLSRQEPTEALETLVMILKRGVIVHSVFDRRVFTYRSVNENVGELLTVLVSMARANEESKIKSSRVRAAYAARRERGELASARVPSWLQIVKKDGKRVVEQVPERVALVRRIFGMAAAGMSAYAIAQVLNAEGVPTLGTHHVRVTGNERWQSTGVLRVLSARTVLGEHTSNITGYDEMGKRTLTPAKTISDFYPAIIDPALYLRAQEAQADRKIKRIRGATGKHFSNLLKGVVSCGHCGSTMRFKTSADRTKKWPDRPSAKPHTFFRCSGADDGICDNGIITHYPVLEDSILEFVTIIDISDDRSAEVAELESRVAGLTLKRTSLLREVRVIMENGGFSKVAMQIASEKEAQADAIEKEVGDFAIKLAAARATLKPEDRQEAVRQLREKLATASEKDRFQIRQALNAAIRQVVDRLLFFDDGYALMSINANTHTQYRFWEGKYVGIRKSDLYERMPHLLEGIDLTKRSSSDRLDPRLQRGPVKAASD